jgi:RNA polymerase sigma factor (sigma-70 family)
MRDGRGGGVLRYFHRLVGSDPADGPTDGQLLAQFLSRRDEAAFAALVCRHGPLVWGVCRRLLRHTQDAEDSFQATFLVLARRAAAIGKPDSLRSWLYGVAYRVAARARGEALRRRAREQPLGEEPPAAPDATEPDLLPVLDEEIGRLPERYRLPVILCHLEGKSQDEAARLLGCPRATVATRLVRGRERLRSRLVRRGLDGSAWALAAATREGVDRKVPPALVEATWRAAAGRGPATGAVSARATLLAQEVIQTMLATRWKAAAALLLTLGLAGTGVAVLASRPQLPSATGERQVQVKPAEAADAPVAHHQPAPAPAVIAPAMSRRTLELRDKPASPVKFDGWENDPKSTLQEALDHLADRFDLTFDVNEAAFKAEMVEDVLAKPVAKKPIPKMINVRLETVLRKILARIPARSGATFLIREDTIELPTVAAVRAELGVEGERPLPPLATASFHDTPLEDALRELAQITECNIVLDARAGEAAQTPVSSNLANVPVDTAVRVLADMANLELVRLDNVLYVTTRENAARLRKEQERPTSGRPTTPAASPPAGRGRP